MISRGCGEVRRGRALPVGLSLLVLSLSLLPSTASNPVGAAAAPLTSLVSSTHKPASTCSVGDVVYLPGDAVPGREACERCECGVGGRLQCRRRACPVRPGCKALHRPDECCPQYQCDCELEGRVYANGEKLVDPVDPCKVCYCQGGEVVCRRIACFLRNDCEPRLVPGRCCPEYDHCPLRGFTTEAGKVAGVTTSVSSASGNKLDTVAQRTEENVKKEITIKEVTPVSEIPAIVSGIRIKEIPPSSIAEATSYFSLTIPISTGPPSSVPAETTHSDGSSPTTESNLPKTEISADKVQVVRTEDQSSVPSTVSMTTLGLTKDLIISSAGSQAVETTPPPRLQKEAAPQAAVTTPKSVSSSSPTTTAQPVPQPIPEEEDAGFELVNPAFPPLPDDLSQLNRDDSDTAEIHEHPYPTLAHTAMPPEATVAPRANADSLPTTISPKTERVPEEWLRENLSTNRPLKTSPLLNLRSALPTEILNVPSAIPEVITGELDSAEENATVVEDSIQQFELSTANALPPGASTLSPVDTSPTVHLDSTTSSSSASVETHQEGEIPNIIFERGSSTAASPARAIEERRSEIAAGAIETVVQESAPAVTTTLVAESIGFGLNYSTENPEAILEISVTASARPVSITHPPEVVQIVHETTTSKNIEFTKGHGSEATEASVDVASSAAEVEVLREADEEDSRSEAIVRASNNHNNVLIDLINLVGDVASIGERTERPRPTVGSGAVERSEPQSVEHSNVVSETASERLSSDATLEISNEDTEPVTDSPPPLDRSEPTTRRPLIDRVSDEQPPSRVAGSTDKTDIEIIGQSYVPTIGRRPTKVVMKKKSERVESAPTSSSAPAATVDPPAPASSPAYSSASASETQ